MTAYIVARIEVTDPTLISDYMTATPAIIAKYHGKFIARGVPSVTFEGPVESRRIVIIEFPGMADTEAFYNSPEYSEVRKLREGIAIAEFIAVEGVK